MANPDAGRRGRPWRRIRAAHRAQSEYDNAPCWLCGQAIDYSLTDPHDDAVYEPDHYYPVGPYPQYAEDPDNLRPSHRGCNRARSDNMALTNLGVISDAYY